MFNSKAFAKSAVKKAIEQSDSLDGGADTSSNADSDFATLVYFIIFECFNQIKEIFT